MIFHNTKLINLGETEVSLFLFVLLVVSFSSPRDADNLSLRFENVCISRRGGDSFIALRFGTYEIELLKNKK